MGHTLLRHWRRTPSFALLSILAALVLPTSAWAIRCQVADVPQFSPAHPTTTDVVSVRAVSLVFFLPPAALPLGVSVLSHIDSLPNNTFAIDVVMTTKPELFEGYRLISNPVDGPIANFGPQPTGIYTITVAIRSGDAPTNLDHTCGSPATTTLVVSTTPGPTATSPVIEYFNALLDHYFITQDAREIGDLDAGVHKGWSRTGGSFNAYKTGQSDARGAPVIRDYGLPSAGLDTHFFTASELEHYSFALSPYWNDWEAESFNVFEIPLPDLDTGVCGANTHPVYRLWNQRADSNHRYTTNPTVKAQMIARGYVAEGYGPDAVAMCAP